MPDSIRDPVGVEQGEHGDERFFIIVSTDPAKNGKTLQGVVLVDSTGAMVDPSAAIGVGGASVRPTGPIALTAGADTAVPFTAKANHWYVQNNTAQPIYVAFDRVATPGDTGVFPAQVAGGIGGTFGGDFGILVLHIWSTLAASVNDTVAGGVVVEGWK